MTTNSKFKNKNNKEIKKMNTELRLWKVIEKDNNVVSLSTTISSGEIKNSKYLDVDIEFIPGNGFNMYELELINDTEIEYEEHRVDSVSISTSGIMELYMLRDTFKDLYEHIDEKIQEFEKK